MVPSKPRLSTPLLSRELDGEVLLDELNELRRAQVSNDALEASLRRLFSLGRSSPSELQQALKGAPKDTPAALAMLLRRWAGWVKSPADVPALLRHLERLLTVGVVLSAIRRGGDRLPRGAR